MKINLIPAAGAGKRFFDAGFKAPKPLINILGEPMILKAIKDLPQADKWIFIVREEHVDLYEIDELLKKSVKNSQVIIEKKPYGQLTSCLLAKNCIKPNDSLLIASCDNTCLYDHKKYNELYVDTAVDMIVWTFTKHETLVGNPKAWGWNKLESDGKTIKSVSVKAPISADPYNDHAVVSRFTFKKAEDFFKAADMLIKTNERINNEFYVDSIPNYLKKTGKRSVIFDVDSYVSWGTPEDLYGFYYNDNII